MNYGDAQYLSGFSPSDRTAHKYRRRQNKAPSGTFSYAAIASRSTRFLGFAPTGGDSRWKSTGISRRYSAIQAPAGSITQGRHDCPGPEPISQLEFCKGFAFIMAKRPPFRTRQEVNRYFGGSTIQCLICGKRFGRLCYHLAAKHAMTADEYKSRFGLPWTRGLTSAQSHANSGWTEARRAKATKLARKSQFFKYAHPTTRREVPEFLKVEMPKHLGPHATGLGKEFDSQVRALYSQGSTNDAIAKILNVHRTTVNRRTKRWRSPVGAKQSPEMSANGSNGSCMPGGIGHNSNDRS